MNNNNQKSQLNYEEELDALERGYQNTSNKRMDDREVDSYYDNYMERQRRHAKVTSPWNDPDMVNSPDHYTHNGIEAINVIEAKLTDEQYQGYLQGSVMKYLLRSNYKGKRDEDLKKAQWYLNTLVENNDEIK